MSIPFIEENDQTIARREHLEALRALVGNVYPNKFERSEVVEPGKEDTITAIVDRFCGSEPKLNSEGKPAAEDLEQANEELNKVTVRIAGRIASPPRVMGKAAFVHLSDGTSRLQIYIRRLTSPAFATTRRAVTSTAGPCFNCWTTATSSASKVTCS